jgi:hypothetical protein
MAERKAIVPKTLNSLLGRDVADAYAEATDGCRYLIPPASQIVRQAQRVKADEETHPLAKLDYEEGATMGEQTPQATLARARTSVR